MLRALWFLSKIVLLVLASVWIALRPGRVDLAWEEFEISVHFGLFLFIILLIFLISMGLYRLCIGLARWPVRMRAFRDQTMIRKGNRALIRGFVGAAAGDARRVQSCAREALNRLGEDHGLALLLSAQAARMRGDLGGANQAYESLMAQEDTAFLGLRGLIHNALDAGQTQEALSYAKKAQSLYPKQPWVQKLLYTLHIRSGHWDEAEKLLPKLRFGRDWTPLEARQAHIALLVLRAEALDAQGSEDAEFILWKAWRLDRTFAPVIARLIPFVSRRRAISLVYKAWKRAPHPDLVALWMDLAPHLANKQITDAKAQTKLKFNKKPVTVAGFLWMERLRLARPECVEGYIGAAQAAFEEGLWGEARARLEEAERLRPCARVYRLRGDLEMRATQDSDSAAHWYALADTAPPERVWTCRESGRIYAHWSALAEPHGSFNTIVWDFPLTGRSYEILKQNSFDMLENSRVGNLLESDLR